MMRRYSRIFLVLFILLAMLPLTLAAEDEGVFAGLFEAASSLGLNYAYGELSDGTTLTPIGVAFMRFILIIMLYAIFYYSLGKVFGKQKNINIALSLTIGLISAISMPEIWINNVFFTVGYVGLILLYLGLAIGAYYWQRKVSESNFLTGLVMIIVAASLYAITVLISELIAKTMPGLRWLPPLLQISVIIYAFVGISRLFGGFSSTRGADDIAQNVWRAGRDGLDGARDRARDGRRREREHVENERNEARQRELQNARQRLNQAAETIMERLRRSRDNEIQHLQNIRNSLRELRAIQDEIRRLQA